MNQPIASLSAMTFHGIFVGQRQATVKELKLKKYGYSLKNVFRLGLNNLSRPTSDFGKLDFRPL
jgi:hypothetical protein